MRLKKVSLLMACICGVLLVGCKATPETEAISQKTNVSEVVAKNKIEVGKDTIGSVVEAPQTEEFEIVSKSGNTIVNVDAKVVVPETNAIPITKVVNRDLSTLDLEGLSKLLFNGDDYSIQRDIEQKSKAEIAEMMEEYKKVLEDDSLYEGLSEEEKEENKKVEQEYLLELQGYYDKAPETVEEVPVEYELKEDKSGVMGENAKTFSVESTQEGVMKNFIVFTGEYFNTVSFFGGGDIGMFEGYFDGYENKCVYSEDEVKKQSEELIKKLGILGEYQLVRCVPTVSYSEDSMKAEDYYNGYQVSYKRVVNEVEETYDSTYIMPEEQQNEGDDMSAALASFPQQYETLDILVGEKGLYSFNWSEPMVADTTIAENVKMISYEEAIKIFKEKAFLNSKMLSEEGQDEETKEGSAEAEKKTCSINEIKLGLMRVKNIDNQGEYTLIPVWDFYGSYGSGESYDISSSYLTISAMDGSIIDRSLGY